MSRQQLAAQSGGYDPDEIHTTSQDDHGHSIHLRVHCPKTWGAILAQIVDSAQWPEYRSNQDIIRDALYHRLNWIDEQKDRSHIPSIQQALARARLQLRLLQDAADAEEWMAFSNMIQTTLNRRIAAGDYAGIKDFVQEAATAVESFQEPYRSQLSEQLRNFYVRAGGSPEEF
jgi:hypothetical protein